MFTGRLLNIEEKHNLSIYVRLHIFSPALTGGCTCKAKSCIGAWVQEVSIHRPLCFKNLHWKARESGERGSIVKTSFFYRIPSILPSFKKKLTFVFQIFLLFYHCWPCLFSFNLQIFGTNTCERHITYSVTKRTASQNVKCTLCKHYKRFVTGYILWCSTLCDLYVLKTLRCGFLTLCAATFCNITSCDVCVILLYVM